MSPEHIPPLRGRATITTVVLVVVLIAACLLLWMYRDTPPFSALLGSSSHAAPAAQGTPKASVAYSCDQNKVVVAQFYDGPSSIAPSGMPLLGGHVVLTLSDGTMMNLSQTVSGSGIRYANDDESFVFWSKGNTAFVQQGPDGTQTYTGCIAQSAKAAGQQNWKAFASSTLGFSVLYPQTYGVDMSYAYTLLGPGKDIPGVKFTIPSSMADGTNLSTDSGVSVEELPQASSCTADKFMGPGAKSVTVEDGDTEYSVASSSDAGAGNLYTEFIYAIPGTSPCIAVRYFIHSTRLENYPQGERHAFDQNALLAQFDQIRQSLVLGR